MESTVVAYFEKLQESTHSPVILSCKKIARNTGFKQRQLFAFLTKSPRFERLEGRTVGYGGSNYNFFALNSC